MYCGTYDLQSKLNDGSKSDILRNQRILVYIQNSKPSRQATLHCMNYMMITITTWYSKR